MRSLQPVQGPVDGSPVCKWTRFPEFGSHVEVPLDQAPEKGNGLGDVRCLYMRRIFEQFGAKLTRCMLLHVFSLEQHSWFPSLVTEIFAHLIDTMLMNSTNVQQWLGKL